NDEAPGQNGDALATVGVSFYPSNKAGALNKGYEKFKLNDLKPFPTAFGYDAEAARDPAAFRVEVIEPNILADRIYVTLEALKPVYVRGKFDHVEEFAGDERKKRALVHVECRPIGTEGDKAHCYRSRYLRLVSDEEDYKALAATKQGLLVTDM